MTAPAPTSVTPSHQPVGGGVLALIAGSGFTGATRVAIAGVAVTDFDVDSDTQISMHPAAGSSGAQELEVSGPTSAVTFTDTGDLVGLNAHGFVANDLVQFPTVVTTTGLVVNTVYHVIAGGLTANAFKVSATQGGSAVALTTDGTGTVRQVGVLAAAVTFGVGEDAIEIANGGGVVLVNESGDDVYVGQNTDPVTYGIKLTTADPPLVIHRLGGKLYAACGSGDSCDLRVLQTG